MPTSVNPISLPMPLGMGTVNVYLRRAFGSRIGMHADDAPMAERGDMFVDRKKSNALLRVLAPRLIGFRKAQRFAPDVLLSEGDSLAEYGLDARVVAIPGHSKGSIGILTEEGDLLCGDLYESIRRPALNSLIDDLPAALASDARVCRMGIRIVYPGHGAAFSPDRLVGTAI